MHATTQPFKSIRLQYPGNPAECNGVSLIFGVDCLSFQSPAPLHVQLECAPQNFSRAERAPIPFIHYSCRTPPRQNPPSAPGGGGGGGGGGRDSKYKNWDAIRRSGAPILILSRKHRFITVQICPIPRVRLSNMSCTYASSLLCE